jgi:hypothetical protein
VIGTVATINTLYNIYFRSLANGMVVKYTATSSGAGLLSLTPTDGFILAADTLYEVFVNKTNSTLTGESLTIGGTASTCYTLTFERINDEVYTTQTLERE